MSVDTVDNAVRERIERYLTDAFIGDRSIDPQAVAEELIRKGVDQPLEDLTKQVRLAANGLGVKVR